MALDRLDVVDGIVLFLHVLCSLGSARDKSVHLVDRGSRAVPLCLLHAISRLGVTVRLHYDDGRSKTRAISATGRQLVVNFAMMSVIIGSSAIALNNISPSENVLSVTAGLIFAIHHTIFMQSTGNKPLIRNTNR